jgi:C4-dicarboxylate transporter, DctQ subunit
LILLRILDRLEEILIATLMALATFIIFLAVCHRYLLGVPFLFPILFPINLSWAQELCSYMFVWVAKFVAAYGVRTGIHVGVDVVVNQIKSPWKNAIVLFGLLCGAFFTAVIGTMGAHFVYGLYYTDQVSPDLEIPSWFVYLCIPLGSYLMCFRFLQVAYRYFFTGDLPHQIESSIGMIMAIDYDIRAADGTQLDHLIHKTIHRVPAEGFQATDR